MKNCFPFHHKNHLLSTWVYFDHFISKYMYGITVLVYLFIAGKQSQTCEPKYHEVSIMNFVLQSSGPGT